MSTLMTAILIGFITLALSTATFSNDKPNLLRNSGFEDGLAGWSVPDNLGTLDNTVAHSGKASLCVSWDDPHKRKLLTIPVKLTPGKRYLIKAWFKSENVKRAGAGAIFGLQWFKGDKSVGGAYPGGIFGTTDWTEVSFVSDTVPSGITKAEIFTCMDWGCSGTYWIDDISVTELDTSNIFKWSIDHETVVGDSGSPPFTVKIDHIDPSVFEEAVDISINLCSPPWNHAISTFKLTAESGTSIQIPTAKLDPGLWKIIVSVVSKKTGKELVQKETRTVYKRPPMQVLTDPHSGILLPGSTFPSLDITPYRNGTITGEIVGSNGQSIAKIKETAVTAGKPAKIKLSGKPAAGNYDVRLKLTSAEASDYSCNLPFTVLSTEEAAKATVIGPDNIILDRGKPWFPMFFYSHTAFTPTTRAEIEKRNQQMTNDLLDHLQGTPFGLLDYAIPIGGMEDTVKLADECGKRGIRFALSVKDLYDGRNCDLRMKSFPGQTPEQAVRDLARRFKDHPALAFYYTNDELSTEYFSRMVEMRRTLHEEDPLHPTLHVHYDLECVSELSSSFDMFGSELYPWPDTDYLPKMVGFCDTSTKSLPKTAPFWGCLMAFSGLPLGDDRERALAYLAIAKGARGFVIYCYHDLRASKNFEVRWKQMVALGNEIQERVPILLQPEDKRPCKTKTPNVTLKTFSGEHGKWLLIVNVTKQVLSAEIDLNAHQIAEVEAGAVSDGKLNLRLSPFDVKFIKLN